MVWIIGEYAERIESSQELISSFVDSFIEESSIVQLQLLTSVVKIFLKCPDPVSHANMERLLSVASFETDNPDIRDRALVYWRVLSSQSNCAHDVILNPKPIVECQPKVHGTWLSYHFFQHLNALHFRSNSTRWMFAATFHGKLNHKKVKIVLRLCWQLRKRCEFLVPCSIYWYLVPGTWKESLFLKQTWNSKKKYFTFTVPRWYMVH